MAGDPVTPPDDSGIQTIAGEPSGATTPAERDPAPPPAQPDTSKLPIATDDQQKAASAVASTPSVTPVTPVRRHGLAGLVDEVRDALAGGNTTTKVYKDANGDKYLKTENLTGGQKWMRIADSVLHGAAAGYGAGRGGNAGAALAAGVNAGDKIAASRKNEARQAEQEVNQQQLEKFNMIKVKHDAAVNEFTLKRMNVLASQEDVKYAQDQIAHEKELGSSDLGTYADAADLARVQAQHPDFWKSVYGNNIVTVPELAADGTRHGIHVFLRTEGIGNDLVPKGTQVYDYVPPEKPGDAPKLVARTLAMPATRNQVDAWNTAAMNKKTAYDKEQADIAAKQAETKVHEGELGVQKSVESKNYADARKANYEAEQAKLANIGEDVDSQAQALVDNRTAVSQLSKRSKDFNAILAKADEISMKQTGQKYDREKGEVNYQNYKETLHYYSPAGKGGQSIESFDKFLGHSVEASEWVNNIRNSDKRVLNIAWNKLRKMDNAPAVKQMMAKLEVARDEYQAVLKNGTGLTEEDIKNAKALVDEDSTPAEMQAALNSMAHTAAIRLRAEDFSFSRVTKTHLPDLISPEGAGALRHFGIDPTSVYSQNAGKPNTPPTNQNGTSGLGVSLKDARLLPQYKDKSDADITAAIKAAGHTVLP